MSQPKVSRVKAEDMELGSYGDSPPKFGNRLNISDFTFSVPAPESVRRSPRVVSPKIEPSTSPSPSPVRTASRKRISDIPSVASPVPTPSRKRVSSDTPATPSSASSSPRKKTRTPTGYAHPSTYAHLNKLVDVLEPNLICVFVGLNPGIRTAIEGHAYSHPSNRFWKLLHSSGLTTALMKPVEDRELPERYSLGNTNIVERPTRNGAELSKAEMDGAVGALEQKMREFKPEVVCIVGKGIWESIWRVRHGRAIKKHEFRYGWQDESEAMGRSQTALKEEIKHEAEEESWMGAKVFVATSTSGLAATPSHPEKEKIWRELGSWVELRRVEKAAAKDNAPGVLN